MDVDTILIFSLGFEALLDLIVFPSVVIFYGLEGSYILVV